MSLSVELDAAISEIKRRVQANLLDRAGLVDGAANPSQYWSGYCERLRYLSGLDNEHFLRLRDHTWQITGDVYSRYMPPLENGYRHRLESGFAALWADLPDHLRLDEPERTFGLEYEGAVVNTDLLRYQRLVAALHDEGLLARDIDSGPKVVVEIGAGYGGLAHQLSACLGDSLERYVVVDLPEVLLLSGIYLSIHDGPDSVHVHDPGDPEATVAQLTDGSARFVLIPNNRLDLINGRRMDLAINVASFQEMTTPQVQEYLATIADNLVGTLVSFNRPFNLETNEEQGDLRVLLDDRYLWKRGELPLTEVPPMRARANRAARALVRRALGRPTRFSEYELILARAA